MARVLVIEKSSTLRHALVRQLGSDGLDAQPVATYEEALARLRDAGEDFAAVVLGWPERAISITDELLVLLDQEAYCHMAVVVLSDSGDRGQLNWITERTGTALLTWEDYGEIGSVLERILGSDAPRTATDATMPGDAGDTRGIRILLVDDSPTARLTYGNLLRRNGYTVEVASSVEDGFEQAVAAPFDIAIIDYFMPGETGDILCRRLRQDSRTREMTNSVLTGTYLDHVIADSLAAGAVECMFKNEANELFLARIAAMSRAVRSRRSVERERRYLGGILNSVGDGVYGVDNVGRLSFMNPTARSMLGFGRNRRIVGEDPRRLLHDVDASGEANTPDTCFLTRAYATGERIADWNAWFRTAEGHRISVEGTVYPLHVDGERQGSVVAFRDVTERRLLEEQLRWQANHDALTKLLNRHYFDEELQREVQRLARSDRQSALMYMDLDQFKYINDTAGHAAGDRLLVEISDRLSQRLRESDTLARLGGDEFAMLLHGVDPDQLFATAESYRGVLDATRITWGGVIYSVTASVGVALIDRQIGDAGAAMANADLAANIAKQQGRNQTHVFEPADGDRRLMNRELGWSARLKRALENDEFELALQPVVPVDVDTRWLENEDAAGRWAGLHDALEPATDWHYEVLLRLRDAEDRWVLPGAFLPSAERFSLMPAIDRWVVERAIELLARGNIDGAMAPSLAINLSGESLADTTLVPWIEELIQRHGVDGSQIAFEITETSAITNLSAVRRLMADLQSVGCLFALDDFGSGFCSFGQLKTLDVDYIKIDGQFIQGLVSDPLDRQVVIAVSRIAHAVGMRTVAEHVEHPGQIAILRECGVDQIQGHCVAPPLLADREIGATVADTG